MAFDKKINLPNVTLAAYTSIRVEETIQALLYSMSGIKFYTVKLISHEEPKNLPAGIEFSKGVKCSNIDEWNHSIIYDLPNHIESDYMILIHDNGFIVNPSLWRDEFLNYDYIGAPWPLPIDSFSYRDMDNNIIRVGNSVSLRSKKLLDVPIKLNLKWKAFHGFTNEDGFINVNYRQEYLKEGCKFPDIEVAKYFSRETPLEENVLLEPFAFHNYSGPNSKYPKF